MDSPGTCLFLLACGMTHLPVEELLSCADSTAAEFKDRDGTNYIDETIVLDRGALELCPPFQEICLQLTKLAIPLWNGYNKHGQMMDLNGAIVLDRDAPGHPYRSISLNNPAVGRWHN